MVTVNKKKEVSIEFEGSDCSKGLINNKPFQCDILKTKENSFHILRNNKSFNVDVISIDHNEKRIIIAVNGNKYYLAIKDKYDELLKNLGLDIFSSGKIQNLKAPMPGLVLDLLVEEGTVVKKGDVLLVLEAMKMENNIKCTADGIVKKIHIKKGMIVEKNQALINFS